jgi:soluble lytic murein transglycosylase-like protein
MAKRRLLWLGLLGLSLGLVSIPTSLPGALTGWQASGGSSEVTRSRTTAERIDEILAAANPGLATYERRRIGAALMRSARRYGLDPDLVLAVILVESDARPEAYSPKGAVGLMQVMPHMMRPLELAGNAATVESNIEAGCFILSDNIRRWGFERGISAYFWGTRVQDDTYLAKVLKARDRVRELLAS